MRRRSLELIEAVQRDGYGLSGCSLGRASKALPSASGGEPQRNEKGHSTG